MAVAPCKLPKSLERICDCAFYECSSLVTVIIALDSHPIDIEDEAFYCCSALANVVLPQNSKATAGDSFDGCTLLKNRFSNIADNIIRGLISRLDDLPVHKLCHYHSLATVEGLRQGIEDQEEVGSSLVDEFGMTPFHILFSTIEPSQELLEVLLENYSNKTLDLKDANDKWAVEYLVSNWTETTSALLRTALQKWIVDPLVRWGAISWTESMLRWAQDILEENDKERRSTFINGAYSEFALYNGVEITSILEMVLWKGQLNHGLINHDTQRQAVDRQELRCVCGSGVVIPSVIQFLGVPRVASESQDNQMYVHRFHLVV
ncbi:unnamed protein product [Cylindrotheca closterium]|uniref:Uncharacterized protein n=1 Tax=Cylindrotheca closterium TaxID=2856 RepID=A0AAD2FRJ0_9STRA|nr:unnamed protein product [Cylindrotheca closterium]